jgi:aspartate racemase
MEYYRIINESFARKLEGLHSARLVLYSLDFDEIQKAQHEDRWDDLAGILINAGNAVKRAGAEFLLICTNAMHKIAEDVEGKVGLPLLHITDVIGEAVREQGMHRIGLLGTKFVMKESFYRERLREHSSVEVLVPEGDDIDTIHRIIYGELCEGKVNASSRRICVDIIGHLVDQGAEGIVLGCTELPLLIRPRDVNTPILDTTRLHAEAAVNLSLQEF